jgi:hypothetical protein
MPHSLRSKPRTPSNNYGGIGVVYEVRLHSDGGLFVEAKYRSVLDPRLTPAPAATPSTTSP